MMLLFLCIKCTWLEKSQYTDFILYMQKKNKKTKENKQKNKKTKNKNKTGLHRQKLPWRTEKYVELLFPTVT